MKDYEWNEEFGTQKANVRAWLLNGNTITPLEALNKYFKDNCLVGVSISANNEQEIDTFVRYMVKYGYLVED